jgi:hypothetical protein
LRTTSFSPGPSLEVILSFRPQKSSYTPSFHRISLPILHATFSSTIAGRLSMRFRYGIRPQRFFSPTPFFHPPRGRRKCPFNSGSRPVPHTHSRKSSHEKRVFPSARGVLPFISRPFGSEKSLS